MEQLAKTHMNQAVAETFETMAFVEALPIDARRIDWENDELVIASLLLNAPKIADFRLIMPRDLLLQIVEALYAEPVEALNEEQLADTLTELLNTIVGQFLNLAFPETVYQLGLPAIEENITAIMAEEAACWGYRVETACLRIDCVGNLSVCQ